MVSTDQSATPSSADPVEPLPISLSPGILDQLVEQVADEVNRRLSPPDETSNTSRSSALSEVLLVSTPPPPTSCVLVPGTSVETPGKAGAMVLGFLSTTQASLSGESQVPTELFSSPSLPIDAGVSEKLRAKIWNKEFFLFQCFTV